MSTLASRFDRDAYDTVEVIGAINGEKLPENLGLRLNQLCTIRGILHHPAFAEGEAASLRSMAGYPEFTRALNARAIMSNRIPVMDPAVYPEQVPYCIWYPEVASDDTYRKLAKEYPEMRYQVARACAVAGYTDLYLELDDILPEVAVAEEARDSGSDAIFEHIMAQPVRYKVFDDYTLTVEIQRPTAAVLNADTCVVAELKRQRQAFRRRDGFTLFGDDEPGFEKLMWNITEDQCIEESLPKSEELPSPPAGFMLDLLSCPLPINLPAGSKDLLILAAAFYGDVDRYVRLRRPVPLQSEIFCVVRGIYHNSLFALWWSRQRPDRWLSSTHRRYVEQAVTARHIMNNDLSRVLSPKHPNDLPYLIWYPNVAKPVVYKALAHKVPEMRESCARACIFAGFWHIFEEIIMLDGIVPNAPLMAEAEESCDPRFASALQARAHELGLDISDPEGKKPLWKMESVRGPSPTWRSIFLITEPNADSIFGQVWDQGAVYNGIQVDMDSLELYLMTPESWRSEKEKIEHEYRTYP